MCFILFLSELFGQLYIYEDHVYTLACWDTDSQQDNDTNHITVN